jgi:hypothetical protein
MSFALDAAIRTGRTKGHCLASLAAAVNVRVAKLSRSKSEGSTRERWPI